MVDAMARAPEGGLDPVQLDAPVVAAIEAGHADIVRFLLDAGADHRRTFARAFPAHRGRCCPRIPRHRQDAAIVGAFLEHGADPNEVYSFEEATGWVLPIDSMLLDEFNDSVEGTPLMLAMQRTDLGGSARWKPDVIRLLIDAGADPTVRSPTCRGCQPTPLRLGQTIEPRFVAGGDSVYAEVMDLVTAATRD
jgi:ankyrin repeat protein